MFFIKMLFNFILGLLLNRDEYRVSSKNFNPIRVMLVPLLVLYSIWVTVRLVHYRTVIETHCAQCVVLLDAEYPVEISEKKKEETD